MHKTGEKLSWKITTKEFEHPLLKRKGRDLENWEAFKELAKEREMTLEEMQKIATNIEKAIAATKTRIISQTKLY